MRVDRREVAGGHVALALRLGALNVAVSLAVGLFAVWLGRAL
jgi:hypothetical protein